jgi:hypothetical protein
MNPALWEELERWAADEFRSVNGQIEYLLQRAVDERRKTSAPRRGEPSPPRRGGNPHPSDPPLPVREERGEEDEE